MYGYIVYDCMYVWLYMCVWLCVCMYMHVYLISWGIVETSISNLTPGDNTKIYCISVAASMETLLTMKEFCS